MINFFGHLIDPVYILILTVVIVSGFLLWLGSIMGKMNALLNQLLLEARRSENTRVAHEASRDTISRLTNEIEAQRRELERNGNTR